MKTCHECPDFPLYDRDPAHEKAAGFWIGLLKRRSGFGLCSFWGSALAATGGNVTVGPEVLALEGVRLCSRRSERNGVNSELPGSR